LRRDVDRLLATAHDAAQARAAEPADDAGRSPSAGRPPKAVVAPHAGYRYSGSTAALAYQTLLDRPAPIRHVVIIGPTHYVGVAGMALPGVDAMATPLGDVPVWADGARAVDGLPGVLTSPLVHAQEHSLEVHLPFLQRALGANGPRPPEPAPAFDVLPVAIGQVDATSVANLLEAVWGGPETLIVASSDLSHYHPYEEAQRLDAQTVRQIVALEYPLDPDQACGAYPVSGLLLQAHRHRMASTLLGACNSGDTSGDKSRVVGYSAIRFDQPLAA
jgi:AmmeMemoRadiSam system protein B